MNKDNLSGYNGDKTMKTTIKQIITIENQENQKFIEYQKERIKELEIMAQKKKQGETIDINNILDDLKRTGILDQNNNITERYSSIFY